MLTHSFFFSSKMFHIPSISSWHFASYVSLTHSPVLTMQLRVINDVIIYTENLELGTAGAKELGTCVTELEHS
jgi:hypothetical protein